MNTRAGNGPFAGQWVHLRNKINVMSLTGLLNVNKPRGWTSRDAVNRVAQLCRPAKAGHAGTLDPLATGVLVICVGQATRLIEYVQKMRKHYRATFLLGRSSDTDDTEGEVTEIEGAVLPTRNQIKATLKQFVGAIQQVPPAHSAIKLQGRRAYELARRGVALELAPREVEVYGLQVDRYDYPALEVEIECGSGTYVRALGRDLAAALGTAAVMSALVRTAVGGFRVEDAVASDQLTSENVALHLQSPLTAVADLPIVTLDERQVVEIRHGRPIEKPKTAAESLPSIASTEWAAITPAGQLAAILREKRVGQLWPHRNFL